jgi:translation initiation factor IF-3
MTNESGASKDGPAINNEIKALEVRLIDASGEMLGVVSIKSALFAASKAGLDLVEISPNGDPPVCKVIDYNKFLYDKKKKEKEMKAKSKTAEVKEIRFTPGTDDHDFDFKAKHAENFLKDGNKVKAYVQFKGRAIMFKERGELVLLKFAERLAEVGLPEGLPKLEGKRMLMIISPRGQKKKPSASQSSSNAAAPIAAAPVSAAPETPSSESED